MAKSLYLQAEWKCVWQILLEVLTFTLESFIRNSTLDRFPTEQAKFKGVSPFLFRI